MVGNTRARRPGVWELRVYVGREANGRDRHRYATFEGGRWEADRALARLAADCERHRAAEPVTAGQGRGWGRTSTVNDAIKGRRENGWEDLSPSTES